jgi:hypothetical protein
MAWSLVYGLLVIVLNCIPALVPISVHGAMQNSNSGFAFSRRGLPGSMQG